MSDYFTHLAMRALGRTRQSDAQPMTRAYRISRSRFLACRECAKE